VKRFALALAALLVAAVPAGITTSGATFVASTANPAASFTTAADFNTVAVALTDPGTPLRGSVSLSATAASDRGIASVRFQTSPADAGTWTDACTDTVAPYTCSFDTTTVADGLRDIRALALDNGGYSRTASVTSRRIDNTAPTTALTDPGTPLTGAKTLNGTASDAGSGLATLTFQYRLSSGGSWTDACPARTSSPATCSLNTATLADGLYDLRTLATDSAGNSASSVVSSRRVDNTAPTVAVVAPPAAVRGTVTLQSTSSDGSGTGITQIKYQFRPASTGTWVDACITTGSPFTCSGDTATIPDGLYDVRAIATDGAGFSTTSATISGRIDNTAPTSATLTNPGSPLSGSVALSGSAADAGSGIESVRVEYAPAGTTTWQTACSDTSAPYSCSWATTGVTDGVFDLRSVATDLAGNTLASATVTSRRVDNNAPTVTLTDPGSPLHGTLNVGATAADGGGIASVTIQRKLSSGSTWTTICTDSSSNYSCSWDTTGVADGNYDLRATAVDNAGRSTTSATVTSRRVDNTAPTGTNVQVANGSGTAHKMDAGDTLTFTWSEQLAPSSILSGWTGSSTTVTVRVADNSSNDTLSIWDAANTTRLRITGLSDLTLRADRTASAGAVFTATAVQSGSSVTITLGALQSGTSKTNTKSQAMAWTPSTLATDLAGNAVSSSTVNESPFAGRDF
jgi:hypothetical protein